MVALCSFGGAVSAQEQAEAQEKAKVQENQKVVDLKLRWEPGKRYHYNIAITSEMAQGDEAVTVREVDTTITRDVTPLDEGLKVSTHTHRMALRVFRNGAKLMEMDTDKQGPGMRAIPDSVLRNLRSREDVIFDKNGKALSHKKTEKIRGEYVPTFQAKSDSFKIVSILIPNKKIALGEVWEAELTQKMNGMPEPATIHYKLKLQSIKEVDGKLIAKVTYSGEVDVLKMKREGVDLEARITDVSGHYLLDVKNNKLLELLQRTEVKVGEGDFKVNLMALSKINYVKEEAFAFQKKEVKNVAQEADLTLKWQPKKSYTFREEDFGNFDFKNIGDMTGRSTTELKAKVIPNEKGIALETTFKKIKFKALAPRGEREEKDSDALGDTPIDKKIKEALKTKFNIQIDAKGNVVRPKKEEADDEDLDEDEEAIADAVSPIELSEFYQEIKESIPNKKVKIGESWKAKLELYLEDKKEILEGTYKLVSITKVDGKTLAKVEYTIADAAFVRELNDDDMTIRANDTVGYYFFDVELGMITRMRTDTLITYEQEGFAGSINKLADGTSGSIYELLKVED